MASSGRLLAVTWMLYGANGYTGRLVAELALRRGHRPLLAGRDGRRVGALAGELGLDHVVVPLTRPAELATALADVEAVAHCAGPFSQTSGPMVDACLAAGVHYVDVTGEIDVLEAVLSRDEEARRAGVALLPGSGFDVVPTDCLAAMLVERLPGTTDLEIAFRGGGGLSPGTARTAIEGITHGGRARVDGGLVAVPPGWRRRIVDLPSGPCSVTSIPWGDVSTAFHSTGVGNVTAYTVVPLSRGQGLVAPVVRVPGVRRLLQTLVSRALTGPGPDRREHSRTEVWVRASAADGSAAVGTMTTPNGYSLTADSVVRVVERLLAGEVAAGAWTPSRAHGPTFALKLDGVVLHGIEVAAG